MLSTVALVRHPSDATAVDLFSTPTPCPGHVAAVDPVMRLAFEVPVANRRFEGDRLAVENHLPISWGEWRDHLVPAAAGTVMCSCRERDRDVQDALLELLGEIVDEEVKQRLLSRHAASPLIKMFPPMT
jgi:hypothetical protein